MSETPNSTVIDRRKFKAEEEQESAQTPSKPQPPEPRRSQPSAGPRLVVNEPAEPGSRQPQAAADEEVPELPPPPPPRRAASRRPPTTPPRSGWKTWSGRRIPAMGAQPPVSFEHLVQQFYVSAMIQMGAGAQEGQRPRVDILGARQTIDLLGVLAEKTRGNLTEAEDRTLQTVLFEVRMAFLELTSMISLQAMQPPAPPPPSRGKR